MGMDFNLEDLLTFHPDLSTLEDDFSAEEINNIVLELPTDKSPGLMALTTNSSRNAGPSLLRTFMTYVKPSNRDFYA